MFPSCYMSSGGKLAPCNRGVNQFFASNEALAEAPRAASGRPTSSAGASTRMLYGRMDVHMKLRAATRAFAETRAVAGLHAIIECMKAAVAVSVPHVSTTVTDGQRGPHARLNDRQPRGQKFFARLPLFGAADT
jgi:hypothetical protein